MDGFAAGADGDIPRLRHPLRHQIKRLDVHFRESDASESVSQPFSGLGIAGGSDNAPPELGMSLIAVAARDGGLLHHVAMQVLAVDGAITLFAGRERPVEQHVVQVAERMSAWLGLRPAGKDQDAGQGGKPDYSYSKEDSSHVVVLCR